MSTFIYPVLNASSVLPAGAATESEQQAQTAELQAINANTTDVATETTLSSLNSKVTAVNTGAVVVSSSALPTGAATSANQTTANSSLSSIDGKIVAVNTGAVVVSSSALPSGAATAANQSTEIGHLATLAGTVTSAKVQVDVISAPSITVTATNLDIRDLTSVSDSVSAVQSGTWNINNISGTVSLPTGAATESTLSTLNGKIPSNLTVTSTRLLVDGSGVTQPVSGTVTANVNLTPVDFLDSGLLDTSSTNITTSGVTVVSSLAAGVKKIQIIEDIGDYMALTNGAGTVLAYLPLGGGELEITIAATTTLKLQSLTGSSITSGKIAMNFLG